MHATDFHGASVPFASLGRSLLSIRRDQIPPADSAPSSTLDNELEAFQRHVADLLNDLSSSPAEDLLSLLFLRRLLDSFLICQEAFRAILFNSKSAFARPPLDRAIADFFDRSVKALDICNAVRDGIDQLRHWTSRLEIVLSALASRSRTLSEGQVLRAKKALADIAILMLDDKDSAGGSAFTRRNRSFGRTTTTKDPYIRQPGHARSLSWSISKTWSAAKQLQAIAGSLVPPRQNEITASNGLIVVVYTMSSVLLFVMWAIVAALPCQDRGLQMHFSIPRSYVWATPIMSLYERIVEESKKKEKKNSSGLLKEIHLIEKCVRQLMELTDVIQFPLTEERESQVREGEEELGQVCDAMKEGLDPLERQVREVFRRIVRSRTESMDSLGQVPHP